MKETITGTAEEVLRRLADLVAGAMGDIDRLDEEITALRLVLQDLVPQFISQATGTPETIWKDGCNGMADSLKDHAARTGGDGPEARAKLERIAEELRRLGKRIPGERLPPRLSVILGGKERDAEPSGGPPKKSEGSLSPRGE